MPTLLLPLMLLTADVSLAPGTYLSYRGSVSPLDANRAVGPPEKTFDLVLLAGKSGEAPAGRMYWAVEERGRGGWSWVERFGGLSVDADGSPGAADGPALLYDLGDSSSVIPLTLPLLAAESELTAGAAWQRGPWSYRVQREAPLDGRDAWQVQVSNNYGTKRVVWLDKSGPLVIGLNERVFMDMGQEYELQLRLVGTERLEEPARDAALAGFEALVELRGRLNRPRRTESAAFSPMQLALLEQELPALEEQISTDVLARLVRIARKDIQLERDRAGAVQQLAAKYQGRPVDAFTIEGLSREALSQDDLRGQVSVLHFWDYRDAPLKEPYGQVGYLDFLAQRRAADGVKVFGVAVDGRLADAGERGAALRGIRKLKSFMNLSYPILLDGGSLIKQFGDPRLVGAELPLFVVVGRDGQIVHYRVGHYEVDRNQGLKQLDEAITAALRESQ